MLPATKRIAIATVVTFAMATSAHALTKLDFEGLGDGASVGGFYSGGTDSQGHGGTDLGVLITGNAVASISSTAGGTGAHTNAASMPTILLLNGITKFQFTKGMGTRLTFVYTRFTTPPVPPGEGVPPPPPPVPDPPPVVTAEDGDGNAVPVLNTPVAFYHTRETGYVYLRQTVEVPEDTETIYIDPALGIGIDDVVSDTPEPAVWMSMILGFGMIGQAMRRRKLAPARRSD